MPTISLQFSAQDDPGSLLIRAFDHGPFSHVDAVLQDGSLLGARSDKIGYIPAGVQIRPASYAAFSVTKRVSLQTTVECENAFYDFVHSEIGKPYDETAILGFAFNRDWREQDSFFCSELIALGLEKSSFFSFPLSAPANKITPADLLLALSAVSNMKGLFS